MTDKLKYTYTENEHGSYIVFRDDANVGLSPQDLCTYLNALEQQVEDVEGELHACKAAFELMRELEVTNETLEQRVEELEDYKEEVKQIINVTYQFTMRRLLAEEKDPTTPQQHPDNGGIT